MKQFILEWISSIWLSHIASMLLVLLIAEREQISLCGCVCLLYFCFCTTICDSYCDLDITFLRPYPVLSISSSGVDIQGA